jgi:hypothetical protein
MKTINKKGKTMLTIIKWLILLSCSVLGMVILATDPTQQSLGFILAFGCFLLFALDVARNFIN